MAGSKLDVLWSPIHHDKFIVWGQDLTLYEVSNLQDIPKNTAYTQLCPTRGATVVASQSASGVRCVDISAVVEHPDPLLALGHGSGRVLLTSFKQAYDSLGLVGKEFVPRYPRQCNSVSWNRSEGHLLVVGMDKHRSDSAVLLWDVQAGAGDDFTESGPLSAAGAGEAAGCVSWCGFAPRTVLASMTSKHIKIFDMRENPGKATSSVSTRQWAGATCAGWLVAARGEGGEAAICVRDARMLTRSLALLPLQRPARKIHWSPTRQNLLISLQRDSTTLRLHDIQHMHDPRRQSLDAAATPALEEGAAAGGGGGGAGAQQSSVTSRSAACRWLRSPVTLHTARGFSRSLLQERRVILCVCVSGCVAEYMVMERVCVSWGASGALAWGGTSLRVLRPAHLPASTPDLDISYKARARALNDYGLKPDLWQNAELAEDEALSSLWHFLALSKSLVEDGCIRNSGWKHPGVRSVLRSPGEGYRSEAVSALLPDLPSRKVTIYRSAERTRALQLCGWGWGWENAAAGVERAEAEGTPCRAAALAAFHLRVRAALDVLSRARAPALPEERLWRDALAAAAPALPDPYLRALLHFVAAAAPPPQQPPAPHHQPDYSDVLNETGMRLEDRVAFACIFLPDGKLHEYLANTWGSLRAEGSLSALLLSGAGAEGAGALQRWLERTGDVQSAALVAARACPPELVREGRAASWLAEYRALLDAWRLWWPRCLLDTWLAAAGAGAEAGAGASVACTYCGKPVAAAGGARPRPAFARLPPPAAKMKQVSSCPNCRKPLPRCGVCSLHLGTGAAGSAGAMVAVGAVGAAAGGAAAGAAFAGWFSWCVSCRHGGHAAHLLQWFSEHAECPVSSCTCRCSELDPPDVPRA
nr:LOW QUALITY PROTEIN: GATOR complex protein MIOS-B [Danaus plexippus plexippus]